MVFTVIMGAAHSRDQCQRWAHAMPLNLVITKTTAIYTQLAILSNTVPRVFQQ
jgi:hypothetical protein